MKIMGISVKVHPLLPFVLVFAMLLGAGADLGIALSSLCLHELSHAMMALALKVRVKEIELMPMGGAARMEDIWQLRPGQVTLIALAGPLMNLVLIMLASSLAWLELMGPYTAWIWIRINIALMLFNLLPALPLDGGRIQTALLGKAIGAQRALRVGVLLGRVLAGCLLLFACAMWWFYGMINLTFVFCAVFLMMSAGRELALSDGAQMMSLIKRQEELADEGVLPVRWLGAGVDQTARDVLMKLQSRSLHRVAVYDHSMRFVGVIEEYQLLDTALGKESRTLGALLAKGSAQKQQIV